MARTESNMMALGTEAPRFSLPDTVTGRELALDQLKSDQGMLVMFICNHCPYVIHLHQEIQSLSAQYRPQGISFVAISSNDVANYPQDSPERMKNLFAELDLDFPYLYDESQAIAKAYNAACTPDFYLFDGQLKCVYRGRADGSSPGNGLPVTGEDLRRAMDNLLAGLPIDTEQFPSMGCSIKWKN